MKINTMLVGENGDRIDVTPHVARRIADGARHRADLARAGAACAAGWVRVAAAAARRRFWRPAVRARESRELAEMGFWLYQVRVMPETRLAQPDRVRRQRQTSARRVRDATAGLTVTRLADGGGVVSFAGTPYACGRRWARAAIDVSIVAGSVQLAKDGEIIRVHPIRHDRTRELGAFANPKGRPRRKNSATGNVA
jgi:hypothetical protein